MAKTYDDILDKSKYDINTNWWQMERGCHEVVECIRSSIGATSLYHEERLRDAAAAFWAYERDKFHFAAYPQFLDLYSSQYGKDWYKTAPKSNEIKKSVDAATSWLFYDMPRIEVRANGAPFELRRAIEERSLALDSTMDTQEARQVWMDVGRDGFLTGFGAVRPMQREGRIEFHRILPNQLWFDPDEAFDADPAQVILAERWDRSDLVAWYSDQDPERIGVPAQKHKLKLETLKTMPSCAGDWLYGDDIYETPHEWQIRHNGQTRKGDQILVLHAWKRSTTNDMDNADGRYVMMICQSKAENPLLLVDQPYLRRHLPLVWWSPYPGPSGGVGGQGLAHTLRGHQYGLDYSNALIQRNMEEVGHYKWFVPKGSAANDTKTRKQLAKRNVTFVEIDGNIQPQMVKSDALPGDHLRWSQEIRSRVPQDTGFGEVITNGRSGLGAAASGVAQVEEADRQTDRVSGEYHRWTTARLKCAKIVLEIIEDAMMTDKEFRASFLDKDGSWKTVAWAKLHRLNDTYQVDVEEAGSLARSRAGRTMKIVELSDRYPKLQPYAEDMLLSSPDLRANARLITASRRLIDAQIAELIDEDGDHEWAMWIDEDQDLDLLIEIVTQSINLARVERAKVETIERLRNYKATAIEIRNSLQPPMPQDPAGGMGAPPMPMV